ncbi:MAG TPA: flagellar hook-basal body complex protein FliE [Candidatus Sulfotelmatobacter sp.]|jgi:flagellar hook-basal body complex protein FliE|nr:flagellar hook-basal body complex protein FliE [Candidatus Sulfotelmatobacter sp.]
MAINSIADAISAYSNASKSFGTSTPADAGNDGAVGSDFASLLKSGTEAAINSGKKSEELSKQAITGKADIPEVVAAVSNAELTLQTVVAVRDKVVSAYNDILKMSF